MIDDRPTRLFVYGTLRRDPSHDMFHLLAKYGRFMGDATVSGRLFDLGEYPGMISSDNAGQVVGEVYEIDPTCWDRVIARLDEYEGCSPEDPQPHEYRRELVNTRLTSGRMLPAWAYVIAGLPEKQREIKSGDYLAWRQQA